MQNLIGHFCVTFSYETLLENNTELNEEIQDGCLISHKRELDFK